MQLSGQPANSDLETLESKIRACRACAPLFRGRFVDPINEDGRLVPKPVFAGGHRCQLMLIGQAPGIKEYETGKAFQGSAGSEIRSIMQSCGVPADKFDDFVYQTSVTKCFPGRKITKRPHKQTGEILLKAEDRVPSVAEVRNCLPFLNQQIRLIQPRIVVTLGGLALKAYLQLRGSKSSTKLENWVGRAEIWEDRKIVFFPHTSGSSRWLNQSANRERFAAAQRLLRDAVTETKGLTRSGR